MRALKLALIIACAAWGVGLAGAANERRRNSDVQAPSAATSSAASPASGFDAFALIVERNIFNPNRTGRSTRAAPEEKPLRVDEIALVGTMQYEKGLVAFFESADASFRKTVRVGESIADFKVERITGAGVSLVRGETALEMNVAQQLRRVEGGDWTVMGAVASSRADSRGPAGGPDRRGEAAAAAEIPADASDVLRRLMQKREKQLK